MVLYSIIVLTNNKEVIMNLNEINKRISDRAECFYWQTDRKISAEELVESVIQTWTNQLDN